MQTSQAITTIVARVVSIHQFSGTFVHLFYFCLRAFLQGGTVPLVLGLLFFMGRVSKAGRGTLAPGQPSLPCKHSAREDLALAPSCVTGNLEK